MNEFEKKVIVMLGKVIDKQNEHDKQFEAIDKRFEAIGEKFDTIDKRFDTIESKLDAVIEQTANNTEFITTIKNDKS